MRFLAVFCLISLGHNLLLINAQQNNFQSDDSYFYHPALINNAFVLSDPEKNVVAPPPIEQHFQPPAPQPAAVQQQLLSPQVQQAVPQQVVTTPQVQQIPHSPHEIQQHVQQSVPQQTIPFLQLVQQSIQQSLPQHAQQQNLHQQVQRQQTVSQSIQVIPQLTLPQPNPQPQGDFQVPDALRTEEPQFKKEFYSYVAPEEAFDDPAAREHIAQAAKKNLRVLFIKTPNNNGLEKAALNLIKHSTEEQTAIYVLSKQTDVDSLAQQVQAVKSESQSKPEVHFVKYNTAADAANAQRYIENQYNTLPGNSRSVNGGPAKVLDFAPQAGGQAHAPTTTTTTEKPRQRTTVKSRDYLPAFLRRRHRLK